MASIDLSGVLAAIGKSITPQLESKIIHQAAGTKRGDSITAALGLPASTTDAEAKVELQNLVDTVLTLAKPHIENVIDNEIVDKFVPVGEQLLARQKANAAIENWVVKI